jgi:hypothetical protein
LEQNILSQAELLEKKIQELEQAEILIQQEQLQKQHLSTQLTQKENEVLK